MYRHLEKTGLAVIAVASISGLAAGYAQPRTFLFAGSAVGMCAVALRVGMRSGVCFPMLSQKELCQELSGEANERQNYHGPPQSPSDLAELLLEQRRYGLLLRPKIAERIDAVLVDRAKSLFEIDMAGIAGGMVHLLPGGVVDFDDETPAGVPVKRVKVSPFFIDRHCVTNAEFLSFVEAGGYEDKSLWESEVVSTLAGFVDASGQPGPRYWHAGRYPAGTSEHPVVGVSWYEASAYARWAGKRLPTDAEWVKAATWSVELNGFLTGRRFPWGDEFDPSRANLWGAGIGATTAARNFGHGDNPVGVRQLCGNVWEWTIGNFYMWQPGCDPEEPVEHGTKMKSLRGGAYDTYFECQATSQFQSGDWPLARRQNVGFRCALGVSDVVESTEQQAF